MGGLTVFWCVAFFVSCSVCSGRISSERHTASNSSGDGLVEPFTPMSFGKKEEAICPWLKSHNGTKALCADGSFSWSCVNGGHGQRVQCSQNLPVMCASKDCGGGKDYCCEKDCESKGGRRPCNKEEEATMEPTTTSSQPSSKEEEATTTEPATTSSQPSGKEEEATTKPATTSSQPSGKGGSGSGHKPCNQVANHSKALKVKKHEKESEADFACEGGTVPTFEKSKILGGNLASVEDLKNSKLCADQKGKKCKLDFVEPADLCKLSNGQVGGKYWRYQLRARAYRRRKFKCYVVRTCKPEEAEFTCKGNTVLTFEKSKSKTSGSLASAEELKNSNLCAGKKCKLDFVGPSDLCRLSNGQVGGRYWRYKLRTPAYSSHKFKCYILHTCKPKEALVQLFEATVTPRQ